MKWLRRLLLILALVGAAAWHLTGLGHVASVSYGSYSVYINSEGINGRWSNEAPSTTGGLEFDHFRWPRVSWRDGWVLPCIDDDQALVVPDPATGKIFYSGPATLTPKSFRVLLPHWLTNLTAWLLFFILWRRARRHPAGRCQRCGYDLTGNESAACPECNESVEAAR